MRKHKRATILVALVCAILLFGSSPTVLAAISIHKAYLPIVIKQVPIPTNTPTPTPTQTLIPSPTTTATVIPVCDVYFAWNYISEQISGGLKVQIGRVLIAEKSKLGQDFSNDPLFDGMDVVAEIIFVITNTTENIIQIYPDQGTVIVGSEQVDLFDFYSTEFGDRFSGKIYPGVKVIGGIWFGFKRTQLSDIQQMTIAIDGPFDESYNNLGPDFNIVFDLSSRQCAPLPDEFR